MFIIFVSSLLAAASLFDSVVALLLACRLLVFV